jgi:lipopolysaccharide transport system ATP-binding protein
MYVRLAFAVAAHLEPDILIVDEVLAVGDAEFQKKCLGKMNEITKTDGRTILFVSHNLGAIETLCPKTALLNQGRVEMFGETKSVIKSYFDIISKHSGDTPLADRDRIRKASLRAKIVGMEMTEENILKSGSPAKIKLKIESYEEDVKTSAQIIISDEFQNLIYVDSVMQNKFFTLKKGVNKIECEIKALNLFSGNYKINCYLTIPNKEIIDYVQDALFFSINSFDPFKNGYNQTKDSGSGYFYVEHSWVQQQF